jgi:hypothetical protein
MRQDASGIQGFPIDRRYCSVGFEVPEVGWGRSPEAPCAAGGVVDDDAGAAPDADGGGAGSSAAGDGAGVAAGGSVGASREAS